MWKETIDKAHQLIQSEIRATPLEFSHPLSELTGAEVFLKLENYQLSGSFKLRGVMNKMLSLDRKEIDAGLVACSTGNHGAAFAHAVHKFSYKGLLFLPHNVSKAKLEALNHYNVELDFHGTDCVVTEAHARTYAEKHHQTLFHPYNDEEIIAGQGTVAKEIVDELEIHPDVVVAPIGGGGLISGLGVYLKEVGNTKVVGCQPINSAVMYESLKAGQILELESKDTLSDATAGGVEENSLTFDICANVVDEIHLIPEDQIKEGVRLLVTHHQMIVEGAAAMTLASLLTNKAKYAGQKVVLVLSGKKLTAAQLASCLQ